MRQTLLLLLAAAGLQAAPITFIGSNGGSATVDNYVIAGDVFSFTILNTSAVGVITGIGFDLPGSHPNTFVLNSASTGTFTIGHDVNPAANAQLNEATFDFVLQTGPNFGGGNPPNGIGAGLSSNIVITGPFGALTADQITLSMSIRLQALVDGGSTVAEPNGFGDDPSVPEPATSVLLGGGLVVIGAMARRKRKTA